MVILGVVRVDNARSISGAGVGFSVVVVVVIVVLFITLSTKLTIAPTIVLVTVSVVSGCVVRISCVVVDEDVLVLYTSPSNTVSLWVMLARLTEPNVWFAIFEIYSTVYDVQKE